MTTSPVHRFFAAAILIAIGTLTGPAFAQVSGADVPKDSYYDKPLTPAERSAIAEEEDVSPNDGRPSVPDAADRGVIPDAVEDGDGSTPSKKAHSRTAESEADVILDESKKNDRVTAKDMSECLKQWDPQTQMSKQEWAESCRTTLEYYPEQK
jgi:hypothetical protein